MKKSHNLVIRKQIIGENLVYTGIWMFVYLIPIMNAHMMSETQIPWANVIKAWLKITPFFILFLTNNLLLAKLIIRRNRRYIGAYLGLSSILICLTFGMIELYEQSHFALSPTGTGAADMILARHASLTDLQWYWNIVLGSFMYAANIGVKLFYKSMQDDEDLEILKRQNIQAEMYYLKYQINPHFFMNTLNNIHALIDIDTETAKQCVIELSNMMRYVVYDSGSEAISLKKDLVFLENYIELMRIRYTDVVDIRFSYPKNLTNKTAVPPLIFIVFVENAFKHGISYNKPSYIHIDITMHDNIVTARFENSVHATKASRQSGIGLENVRKRLELIYGERFELKIEDNNEDKYCITLSIPTINNNDKVLGN